MNAVVELEKLGYTFTLNGDKIRYTHAGEPSDPAQAALLLSELKRRRGEGIQFLQNRIRWVDPDVARLVSQWPYPECWPVTLFANDGTRPVLFNSPGKLMAAAIKPDCEKRG